MINCDAIMKAINEMILGEFLSEILLSYAFERNKLYNVLHAIELNVDPYNDNAKTYDRKYHVERSYRRIEHIASRLKIEGQSAGGSIFEAKIYDQVMCTELVNSYNRIAFYLNRPTVVIINEKMVQLAALDPGDVPKCHDDALVQCGYCVGIPMMERNAIAFPELLIYTGLYMSTRARAISTLNKQLTEKKDYVRALRWYERLKAELESVVFYEAIVYELFDMLFDKVAASFVEVNESHIQQYWLDEKYRNRKDRKRVLKQLDRLTIDGEVLRTYLWKQLEEHHERSQPFFKSFEKLNICTMMLDDIMPRAEMIALRKMAGVSQQELASAEKTVDLNNNKERDAFEELQLRAVATWLAEIFLSVIEEGYGIMEKMLLCLPESIAWMDS